MLYTRDLLYPNLSMCLQLCQLQYLCDTDERLESELLQQQEATSHSLAWGVHTCSTEVPTERGAGCQLPLQSLCC